MDAFARHLWSGRISHYEKGLGHSEMEARVSVDKTANRILILENGIPYNRTPSIHPKLGPLMKIERESLGHIV